MKRSMLKWASAVTIGAIVIGLSGLPTTGADKPDPKAKPAAASGVAEVVGLSVAKPDPSNKYGGSAAFGLHSGTRVYFRVRFDGREIIDAIRSKSSVHAFKDDKGTNLLAAPKNRSGFQTSGIDGLGWFRVSNSRKTLSFNVNAKATPAKGATKLGVGGTLAVLTGSAPGDAEVASLPLTEGTKAKIGALALKVDRVRARKDGEEKLELSLASSQNLQGVRKWQFFDAAGKEIKARSVGSSSMGGFGETKYTQSFALARKVDAVRVRINYYTKTETVMLPFKATVSVGL